MKTVKFVPNLHVGELDALVLCEYEGRVALLCQDRISVAYFNGEVYVPVEGMELFNIDLYAFIMGWINPQMK